MRNCEVGRYHDFKVLVEGPPVQREVCRHCKTVKEYKFTEDGRLVDDEQYFKDHIRAFAQPNMKVFHDIYPEAEAKFIKQEADKKLMEDFIANRKERFFWEIEKILTE